MIEEVNRFARAIGILLIAWAMPFPAVSETPPTQPSAESWVELARTHLDRYPAMQAEDLYKLIYQATRGPGHYGMSLDPVLSYLEHEANGLDSARFQDTLLIEPIGPTYARLYLGPYLAKGGTLEELADAQVFSAVQVPDPSLLGIAWAHILQAGAAGELTPVDQTGLDELTELLHDKNWPAVHHSEFYRQEYDPHYRVLLRDRALKICAKWMTADREE